MLKKNIIRILIVIAICFIAFLCNNKVKALDGWSIIDTYYNGKTGGGVAEQGYPNLQYVSYLNYECKDMENMFFCNKLGYPPIMVNLEEGIPTTGSPDTSECNYTYKTDDINPQLAYALSIGITPANLGGTEESWKDFQRLIWDAKDDVAGTNELLDRTDGIKAQASWIGELDDLIPIEVKRFRKVYEEIFEKTIGENKSVFKIENSKSSLFVDQNDGTYIYGPFQLKLNTDASDEAIQYLMKEIMQQGHEKYIDYDNSVEFENSEAYIESYLTIHKTLNEKFIKNGISDATKNKLKYNITGNSTDNNSYSTILVDKNGQPVDFPKFNNTTSDENNFFIKFYPAKEGAIINLGTADDSMFDLKIKYGAYVNYKEHRQEGSFEGKGLYGIIRSKSGQITIIPPSYSYYGQNPDQIFHALENSFDFYVIWNRISSGEGNEVTGNKPITWYSNLGYIYRPDYTVVYNAQTRSIIKNSLFSYGKSNPYTYKDEGVEEKNYYLDNYYPNLYVLGMGGESDMTTPFSYAGMNGPEDTDYLDVHKKNYQFPLKKEMKLQGFYGIVKEKATITSYSTKKKTIIDKAKYDSYGNIIEIIESHEEKVDTWTQNQTVYRYRYASLSADQVNNFVLKNGKINTGNSPANAGTNTYTKPSKPTTSEPYTRYEDVTHDSLDNASWEIVEIYGGNTNHSYKKEDGTEYDPASTYGFRYRTQNTGWQLALEYASYGKRLELWESLGQAGEHDFEYKLGGGDISEYTVWFPYDETFGRASTPERHQAEKLQANITKLKAYMQSFVTLETEDDTDIYKFGTKIEIEKFAMPKTKIAEAFGGNVWKESIAVKGLGQNSVDGWRDILNEESFQGMKVDLYECKINYKEPQRNLFITDDDIDKVGTYITSTFTDKNGDYRFYGKIADNTPLINPLRKYFVKFVYNGQLYTQTLYNTGMDSSYGEYKDYTSKAVDEHRTEFNTRFTDIYSSENNYTYAGQRYAGCNGTLNQNYSYTGRAYGLKHVVQEAIDNPNFNANLDTFEEQYNLFIKNNTHAELIKESIDYQFYHNPGNKLDEPINENNGEIVSSDIDKQWEYPAKLPEQEVAQYPVDYNYSGLSDSVKHYLQDCMIEASVPYTPDLTVYGRNMGETNLKTFPEQATFCLKDMGKTYMDKYVKWRLNLKERWVENPNPNVIYPTDIPEALKAIIKKLGLQPTTKFEEGTTIYEYEYKGEKYVHIEYPKTGESKDIKLASLNINSDISEPIKIAAGPDDIPVYPPPPPEDNPGTGEPDTPNPPGPETTTYPEWYLVWEVEAHEEVHDIDHYYEPPREVYINLYNKEFDLRHCWNFGTYQRENNEVELTKDLYKATLVVNGKKEVYNYADKDKIVDSDNYNFEPDYVEKINKTLDGGTPYNREIRKSDYLYDENIAYGNGQYSKNIKAYLTYKIHIHNTSPYAVKINEIADYYDADNLEFDGVKDAKGNLIIDANGKYQIETHTENTDGNIERSKYTYATNLRDTLGHNPDKEYIGIYESSAYTHDKNGNGLAVKEEFYIPNTDADNDKQPYHLKTLYIRGTGAEEGIPVITKDANGDEQCSYTLSKSQGTVIFVTFRVKNNSIDKNIKTFANQIKLDQITRDFADQLPTIGKNNFAEINSYSSYYSANIPADATMADEKVFYTPYGIGMVKYTGGKAIYLDAKGKQVGEETYQSNPEMFNAGMVDVYSDPGNFRSSNVEVVYTEGGKYKSMQFKDNSYRKITRNPNGPKLNKGEPNEEALPQIEPDMDKAPSIRLILDNDEVRKISGYVFEDDRNVNSDGSPIGDGERSNNEKKINGVTVQLVELIQDVDYDGTFTGQYIGEKVWDECEYTGLASDKNNQYQLKAGSQNQGAQYYSGKGTKYILNATSNLAQIYSDPTKFDEPQEDGKYCFAGLPSGDFIIRFIYGDTTRTVLTSGVNEVNTLVGAAGLNAKSYNGQDYKSTVYQRNVSTNKQVNQNAISYKMKNNQQVAGYLDTAKQDYASTYNYNNNTLRSKEQLYNSGIIYYAGQPINNSGDLNASRNVQGANPRTNISNAYDTMWRYDRVATQNLPGLSDANDLYGYRQRGIDYAQGYTTGVTESEKTLLNYRAEVLDSFEKVTSQENKDGTPNSKAQIALINELIENTYMVAQTGIISMNNEYEGINDKNNNTETGNSDNLTSLHTVYGNTTHENHLKNVDLGLVERPKAQVKLTKEVSNVEIKLADGQTLFNANTSMKNLMFKDHSQHEITYSNKGNGPTLESVRVTLDTQAKPELIKAEMDDEIMNGATINVTYHLQVENVGEIDYQDRDFYYFGKKSAAATEPVRTKVVRVIDYVPNDASYDSAKQNSDAHWDVYKASEIMQSRITEDSFKNNVIAQITDTEFNAEFKDVPSTNNGFINKITPRNAVGNLYDKINRDYVTRTYANEVSTYNTIVVTKDMNDNLLPTLYVKNNKSLEGHNIDNTTLILTTSITSSGNSEDLTYNNLAEVIETSNSYGRRMQFSISGNQEMANQDINDGGGTRGDQEHHAYSSSKIVQPKEIDADSAQQIQILPPTGSPEYRNKILTIITTTIATIIVLVGAVIIKKKVYDK